MDIVEVASHVMQLFARDARVLQRISRHERSGQPIPQRLLDSMLASSSQFEALDTQKQVHANSPCFIIVLTPCLFVSDVTIVFSIQDLSVC